MTEKKITEEEKTDLLVEHLGDEELDDDFVCEISEEFMNIDFSCEEAAEDWLTLNIEMRGNE